jgi:hypothetical protein
MVRACFVLALIPLAIAHAIAADVIHGWHLSGSNRTDYSVSLDRTAPHSGATSALLASNVEAPPGFGTLMQETRGVDMKGKRVRFTAHVRTEGVKDYAGLWMRVDGSSDMPLAFDNMQDRPITGDTAWTAYSIVLDVPAESTLVAFGVLLRGAGKVWLDAASFETVADTERTTDSVQRPTVPAKPTNLDFEQ